VPGWHDFTENARSSGKIRTIGIIEDQHPDRARLFMQWKQMDWPILVDPLNRLGVEVVPITLLLDEAGVVRAVNPTREDFTRFIQEPPATAGAASDRTALPRPSLAALKENTAQGGVDAILRYGDAAVEWGNGSRLDEAIAAYERALEFEPDNGAVHFRLGAVYRMRFDSDSRREGDFRRAVEHWQRALDIDPNQYIWHRRIQQYGPRLDKPYPFFDWVDTARQEIRARGEEPILLTVEPGGAEIAAPLETFEKGESAVRAPDEDGRITRDQEGFIRLERTVVPAAIQEGASARVHLVFRPNPEIKAHWNNEVEPLSVWVDPPEGWALDSRLHHASQPPEPVSVEPRRIEFELRAPADFSGPARIPGYALYYVCEDVNGMCVFRRQDFQIELTVRPGP
jgi:hypothetical protein